MKRLIMLSILILVLFSGCNYKVFDLSYEYNKIICNYEGDKFELHIDSWKDYEGEQLQVWSNGNIYLLSANKCYMIKEVK